MRYGKNVQRSFVGAHAGVYAYVGPDDLVLIELVFLRLHKFRPSRDNDNYT